MVAYVKHAPSIACAVNGQLAILIVELNYTICLGKADSRLRHVAEDALLVGG